MVGALCKHATTEITVQTERVRTCFLEFAPDRTWKTRARGVFPARRFVANQVPYFRHKNATKTEQP